jgi:hypothetical protein
LDLIQPLQITEKLVGEIDPEWNRPFPTTTRNKILFSQIIFSPLHLFDSTHQSIENQGYQMTDEIINGKQREGDTETTATNGPQERVVTIIAR